MYMFSLGVSGGLLAVFTLHDQRLNECITLYIGYVPNHDTKNAKANESAIQFQDSPQDDTL